MDVFLSNITVSLVLFVTSNVALFLINFNDLNDSHASYLSYKQSFNQYQFLLSQLYNYLFSWKYRNQSTQKSKARLLGIYHTFQFFIPKTISTLSNISDTNVNTSNLCPFISMITSITNNTPTY